VKILIAEDEYTTRLMVQVSLENWGYKVESAVDGNEAWSLMKKQEPPDIAILDWEMPEMDGIEVCLRIKELKRKNPVYVILLTGRDSQNDILQGFDAGADDYITKPFNDNELRSRVRVAERIVRIQSTLTKSLEELKMALDLVETFPDNVCVCSNCRKIEGEDASWHQLEAYVDNNNDSRFVQTICPECASNGN